MGPFETAVAIVAIIMIAKFATAKYGSKAMSDDGVAAPDTDELRTEIRKLKERVAVLERLATDDSRSLEREIEKLRDRP